MFKKILSVFFIIAIFQSTAFAAEENSQVENWNSAEGLKRLERSKFKNDFYQLANFYQPQINPLYCSAASGVAILNALYYGNIPSQKELEVTKPEAAGGGIIDFPLYSQQTFFNEKTDEIKKREIIDFKEQKQLSDGKKSFDPGLTLDEFSQILYKVYKLKTKVTHVEKDNEKSFEKFRTQLKKVLADDKNFMIVGFDRKTLGQKGDGHFSSVTAYDEESDSVLVFDVALQKYQWFWVPAKTLFAAMNTKDGEVYRGYLVVGRY